MSDLTYFYWCAANKPNLQIDLYKLIGTQLGPFVDALHPKIINGDVTQSPNELWRDQILSRLHTIIDHSPATHIILIPSVRDIVDAHVPYPQAMFEKDVLGIPKVFIVSTIILV